MPLQITMNPRPAGNLSIAANQRARFSSVLSLPWDSVTGKPDFATTYQPLDSDLTAIAALTTTSYGRAFLALADAAAARTAIGTVIGTDVQAYDADLAALAANTSNGLWARTSAGNGSARTITGTANEITSTNGDGVSGNPTVSLPAALTFTGKTVTGGTFVEPLIAKVIGGSAAGSDLTLQTTTGNGSGDEFIWLRGNNGATQAAKLNATGFGVGTTDPDVKFTVNDNTAATVAPAAGTIFHLIGADAANPVFVFDTFGGIPGIQGRRANGTLASKTAIASGDAMNSGAMQGWDGSAYAAGGGFIMGATEAWSGSAHGSFMSFRTVAAGATSVAERARVQVGFSVGTTTDPGAGAILANTSIKATTTLQTGVYTVATLPAAGTKGRIAYVSDANATTFASTVAGGGANNVPVTDDGTNWKIG